MKQSLFVALLFAVAVSFLFTTQAHAQYVYGVSSLTYDPYSQNVFGYSATDLDYYTAYYYDAYVEGSLYGFAGAFSGGSHWDQSGEGLAQVYSQLPATPDQFYDLYSDHYVVAYYSEYLPTIGWQYVDQYGYDLLPGGSYPGGYYFLPSYETYTSYEWIYLGNTGVSLGTPPASSSVNYLGFKDDHKIYEYNPNDATETGGTAIDVNDDDPVWDRTPPRSLPAAYTRGAKPKMFIIVSVDPPLRSGTSITVRAKLNGEVIATKSATVGGGSPKIDNIQISNDKDLETNTMAVKKGEYTFNWEMRINNSTWRSIGNSGPHTIYWTWDAPKTNPFVIDMSNDPIGGFRQDIYPRIYDRALEIACGNANGASSIQDIVDANNKGVYDNAPYQYTRLPSGVHPLQKYNASIPNNGSNCMSHASLLTGLLKSIGIDASTNYLWGGNSQERHWYIYPGYGPNDPVSIKLTRIRYERFGFVAPLNPHFTYHALTTVGNTNYDPSYGLPNANTPVASIQAEEAYNKTTSTWDVNNTGFTTTFRSNIWGDPNNLPTCGHQ